MSFDFSLDPFMQSSKQRTISTAVVLALRADVNQAKDFFVSAKLIDSQASNDVFKVPLRIV